MWSFIQLPVPVARPFAGGLLSVASDSSGKAVRMQPARHGGGCACGPTCVRSAGGAGATAAAARAAGTGVHRGRPDRPDLCELGRNH